MALSNSQLADKISALVDRWNLREDEMIDWINGVVGGGPNGDGTYPITDGQDVTTYVTCPAQLEADVESTTDSAKAYRDKAALWAEESEDIEVETGAFSALHHAAKADASASAAATSESNAATSETNAANSASAASTSETNASDSETAAANSEVNASDSATVSQEWADTAEDTLVPSGNGTDDYSALHHAAKAEQSATNAATSESNAATSETNAASSASDAAASLTEFENTYYGQYSSDPSTDPNGGSPTTGDVYFNTTVSRFKVYDGSAWINPVDGAAAVSYDNSNSWPTATNAQNALDQVADKIGRKNALINGGFDIWQRGTSFSSSGYWADRWRGDFGDGAGTVSQQAFTLGQTAVPGEPEFYLRHDRTTASTVANRAIAQRAEDVRTLAGRKATISFYAKADAAKDFTVRLIQSFGSGANASSNVTTTVGTLSVGTSWTRYTFTVDVPGISGKTIDGNDSFLQFDITEDANFSTFTFDIAQVQIEEGPVATPFERRPIGEELALCQRYYLSTQAGIVSLATSSGQVIGSHVLWPTATRSVPALTLGSYSNSSAIDTSTIRTTDVTKTGARLQVNTSRSSGAAFLNGQKIFVDAEL